MKQSLLFLSLFLNCIIAFSQTVSINGINKSYANSKLQVKTNTDAISSTERTLGETLVQADGSFQLQFEIKKTQLVFLPLGIYRGFLFVEPGQSYEIKLPPRQDRTPAEKLNPYFEEEELLLGLAGGKSNELNYLIRKFDDQLDGFINQNFHRIYRKKERSTGHQFAKNLKEEYSDSTSPFFMDYMEYRLGLLDFLANPQAFGVLENKYFKNRKVQFYNPAYTSLFKKLYGNFLTGYFDRKEGPALKTALRSEAPYQNLAALLSKYETYQDEDLRDIILLCGLFDGYTRKFFSRKNLLSVSKVMATEATNSHNRTLAKNITNSLNHLRQGHPAPAFQLAQGDSVTKLEDYKGQYLYLNFCNTQSYACQQDFEELEKLHQQFNKHIKFLSIVTNWDAKTYEEFQLKSNYSWPMIHIGDQQEIARKYNVRAYPTYFLIDPKGNITKAPAPGPKEHIEQEFMKIERDALRNSFRKSYQK